MSDSSILFCALLAEREEARYPASPTEERWPEVLSAFSALPISAQSDVLAAFARANQRCRAKERGE